MFVLRVKVIEHQTDGTDRELRSGTWASPTGNTRGPELFIQETYKELTGENIDVQISSAKWRIDSPDGRYSWTAAWEANI